MKLLLMLVMVLGLRAEVTATFYPEQTVDVPTTGQPITVYRVDVIADSTPAAKIYPIEVFRAYPELLPLTKERATLDLQTKTDRTFLKTAGRVLTATAATSAVVLSVQSLLKSSDPNGEHITAAKWATISTAAAFISQFGPVIGRQIAGEAPEYKMPEDTLSTTPFDLAPGEAISFHVVARGKEFPSKTGKVR